MLNGKTLIILSIIGQIRKTLHKISKYFSKPYDRFGGNVKVELGFYDYAIKIDLEKQHYLIHLINSNKIKFGETKSWSR